MTMWNCLLTVWRWLITVLHADTSNRVSTPSASFLMTSKTLREFDFEKLSSKINYAGD